MTTSSSPVARRVMHRGKYTATVKYLVPLDDDGADATAAVGPGWVLVAVDGAGAVYHFNREGVTR